jgi:hypothetical protein
MAREAITNAKPITPFIAFSARPTRQPVQPFLRNDLCRCDRFLPCDVQCFRSERAAVLTWNFWLCDSHSPPVAACIEFTHKVYDVSMDDDGFAHEVCPIQLKTPAYPDTR